MLSRIRQHWATGRTTGIATDTATARCLKLSSLVWLWIGLAIGWGAFLRLSAVGDQIVYGDEFHPASRAIALSYTDIATHFYPSDGSLPYTLITKVIADTVGLSEITLRLPVILAGLLSLLALPVLVRRHFGGIAAGAFALLLAISPVLILYSRFARPYTICALLTMYGVFQFFRWWTEGGHSQAVLYVTSSVAAIYFHPFAAPAVLAPFLFAAFEIARAPSREEQLHLLRRCVKVGLGVVALLIVLFIPPIWQSLGAIHSKVGEASFSLTTFTGVLHVIAGTSNSAVAAAFWLLCLAGFGLALRHQPRLTALMLTVVSAQVIAILLIGPELAHRPHVFGRYCSVVFPFLYVFFVLPFAELSRLLGERREWIAAALATAVAVVLFCSGPIVDWLGGAGNFTSHPSRIPTGRTVSAAPGERVSEFYADLARSPVDFSVIEGPWHDHAMNKWLMLLQHEHGKGVFIGFLKPQGRSQTVASYPVRLPLLHFERFVDLTDCVDIERTEARFAIVHRAIVDEIGAVAKVPAKPGLDTSALIDQLRARYGTAHYQDQWITVFDLRKAALECEPHARLPWADDE